MPTKQNELIYVHYIGFSKNMTKSRTRNLSEQVKNSRINPF